jgi:hypothetical protein
MMIHMSKEQAFCVALDHIVNSDEIRRVLIVPRKYPSDVRRDIAERLASHLLGNEIKNNIPEEASVAVGAMTSSKEWTQIMNAAGKNDLMPKFILKTMLTSLFASLESDDPDTVIKNTKASWETISSFAGTMDMILSLSPVSGFNYSVRDAYSELISNTKRYESLIERNDDTEWIAKIVKFMGSEMAGHTAERTGVRRELLMVIDTSQSMYGEPELIAKGLSLALTKQMLQYDNDVKVLLFSSDLPVLLPSDGRDMMELLSFRSGTGKPFSHALDTLLEEMKRMSMSGTDLILVSK